MDLVMITKAIITAAGLGTRLLPYTMEQPKEMLPIYNLHDGFIILKPALQIIFEQIYDFGIREFCFIVGRGKRVIEDYFTPGYDFYNILTEKRNVKSYSVSQIETFYSKIRDSSIVWINQSPPNGFGDAVLSARSFIGSEDFFLFAGDTIILCKNNKDMPHLSRLQEYYEKERAYSAILLLNVNDPYNYGVVCGEEKENVFYINNLIEKPSEFISDIAIMPIYILKSNILDYLEIIKNGNHNEIQLTDAIQLAASNGKKVIGTKLKNDELRLDIGTPENYFDSVTSSYYHCKKIAG